MCRGVTARVPTEEDDIHEDFKPKFKAEAEPRSAPSATEQIKQDITEHDVFLYMKVWRSSRQLCQLTNESSLAGLCCQARKTSRATTCVTEIAVL